MPRLVFAAAGPEGERIAEREVLIEAPTALDAVERAWAWAAAHAVTHGECLGLVGMLAPDATRPTDGDEFGGWFAEGDLDQFRAWVKPNDELAAIRAELAASASPTDRPGWYTGVLSFAYGLDDPPVVNEVCVVLFAAPTARAALTKAHAWGAEHAAPEGYVFLGLTRLEQVAGGEPRDGSELIAWPLDSSRAEALAHVLHPTELQAVRFEGLDGMRPLGALMTEAERRRFLRLTGNDDGERGS